MNAASDSQPALKPGEKRYKTAPQQKETKYELMGLDKAD